MYKGREEKATSNSEKPILDTSNSAQATPVVEGNYLPESLPGCLVVRKDTEWIIEHYDFDAEELGLPENPDEVPDFLVDPETCILSAVNPDNLYKTFYLSIDCEALDRDGALLPDGPYFDGKDWQRCRTFIIVLEPMKAVDVCFLSNPSPDMMFESDVQPLIVHPDPWTFSDVVTNQYYSS